jgi:uncharacterized membrane protein
MKPEIKKHLEEHGDDPLPTLRYALLRDGHSAEEIEEAFQEWQSGVPAPLPEEERRRAFDRWATGFHIAGLVWVAAWLLFLPDSIAEGRALTAFVVVAVSLLIGWIVSLLIGRWMLSRTSLLVALVVPFISALVITFGMFNVMGGRM